MTERATLLAAVDQPGEAEAAEAWLEAARDRLTHVSDQLGCGCCVVMWEVEGPAGLIATMPENLRAQSAPPQQPSLLARLCRRVRRGFS